MAERSDLAVSGDEKGFESFGLMEGRNAGCLKAANVEMIGLGQVAAVAW